MVRCHWMPLDGQKQVCSTNSVGFELGSCERRTEEVLREIRGGQAADLFGFPKKFPFCSLDNFEYPEKFSSDPGSRSFEGNVRTRD